MSVQRSAAATSADKRAGKYLTFGLGAEDFGLEILKVREINGMVPITAVPQMPDYVNGVINLRGKIIPVIDLRLKFGMSKAERTGQTCIIVVDVQGELRGVVVDRVSEVLDIYGQDIEDAPNIGENIDMSFVLGIGKAKGAVKILLDIDRVLSDVKCDDLTETEVEAE